MIRFLQHHQIEKSKWDNCIKNAHNSRIYALSWYLDIVSPGWCALADENYSIVFPLPVKSKFGIQYIIQPYFVQQLGLFSIHTVTATQAQEFINLIPKQYKFIDIGLNSMNDFLQNAYTTKARNLKLDMRQNYLHIYTNYKTNLQRNIRKAASLSLQIFEHCRPEELIQVFKENRGKTLKNLTIEEYDLIQRIAYTLIHTGQGEIWGIYDEYNQLCAAVLWAVHNDRRIFLFSALSETGKQNNAMPFLIDQYIQRHAGENFFLDFEGSNDDGLARFYSSFGSEEETYFRFTQYRMPYGISHVAKWLKKVKE